MQAPGSEALAPPEARGVVAIPAQAPLALVVDDEETARFVLRRCLTLVGCRVLEARGGEEALARAIADRPDVIFLDLRMPDMMGTEVLARLKRNTATAGIPVVIATSQIIAPVERERLQAHAIAVLGKSLIGGRDGDEEVRRVLRAAHVLA
jgi:CheY-like chemotaxis protein